MKHPSPIFTLPNLVTGFRFIAAPILLVLAWFNHPHLYLVILFCSFLSDALDGYIARRLQQESALGTQLDTWADIIMYFVIPLSAWWLWPEVIRREAPYVFAIVASYTIPAIFGIIKFRALTAYHTWGIKLAAAAVGLSSIVLFLGASARPFHLATILCVLVALEQLAITWLLAEHRSNVRTLWHVLRSRSTGNGHSAK